MERWAAGALVPGPGAVVLLAGVAGGLRDSIPLRSAVVASAVIEETGRRFVPSLRVPGGATATLVESARAVLTQPHEKRAWAERTGADLVDRESAAFARLAERAGWRWAVVRGVSDGTAVSLPPEIDTWVDPHGRTRFARLLRDLARRPARLRDLARLRADAVAAMEAVSALLEAFLTAPAPPMP